MHFVSSSDFIINAVMCFFTPLINLCSSRGQHFLKCGPQSPKVAVSRVFLELIPHCVREALSSQNARPGQGNWLVIYVCLSKQPVPAPSRDLSNWSCTSQLGTAEAWSGMAESWHWMPQTCQKTFLMKKKRTLWIPHELPEGYWLPVYSYFWRSVI